MSLAKIPSGAKRSQIMSLEADCEGVFNWPRSISKCNISLWDDVAWASVTSS